MLDLPVGSKLSLLAKQPCNFPYWTYSAHSLGPIILIQAQNESLFGVATLPEQLRRISCAG
jgi:hypothetical protein